MRFRSIQSRLGHFLFALGILLSSRTEAVEKCSPALKAFRAIPKMGDRALSATAQTGISSFRAVSTAFRWIWKSKTRRIVASGIIGFGIFFAAPILPTHEGITAIYPLVYQNTRDRWNRNASNEPQVESLNKFHRDATSPKERYGNYPQGIQMFSKEELP